MSKMIKSFKVNGENKKEISPNSHIYFPIKLIESIEQSAVTETGMIDWKKILKLALMEIYGNSIANYSAIGRNKNSRPPIDHDIYEGIFQWVLLKSKEKISKHDYTNEITSLIANKRVAKLSNNKSPEIISELELQFFQKVISAVEKEDKWHHNSDNHLSLMNSESHNSFLIPGATKARISEEHNIFFPKSTIAYIEKRTEKSGNSNLSDWKNLVKEALIQIYGSNVGNFCAKGNVASRTPINSQLFDALYTWANSRSEESITEKEFIQHINKIASNKRKNKNFTLASKTTITTGSSVQKCSLNPSLPGSKQLYPPKIGSMNRDFGAAYNQDSDSTPSSTASPLIFNQHDSSSIQQVNPDSKYDHDLGLRPTQSSIDSSLMPRQYDSSNVQQGYPYSSASYQDQHFNYGYRETYPVVKMFIIVVTIFGVCWLPYHGFFIFLYHYRSVMATSYVQHVYLSFYWLAMSNAVVNPIIYYWMNNRFRVYFQQIICNCCCLLGYSDSENCQMQEMTRLRHSDTVRSQSGRFKSMSIRWRHSTAESHVQTLRMNSRSICDKNHLHPGTTNI